MQVDPAGYKGLIDWLVSLGPNALLAYLLYKDLFQPWKSAKSDKGKITFPTNGSAYVRETDFQGLAGTLRDHLDRYDVDIRDIRALRERIVRVETILETDGHGHGRSE